MAIPAKLVKNNIVTTDGQNICKCINKIFSTIDLKLARAILIQYHNNIIHNAARVEFSQTAFGLHTLTPSTTNEVLKLISDLNINK